MALLIRVLRIGAYVQVVLAFVYVVSSFQDTPSVWMSTAMIAAAAIGSAVTIVVMMGLAEALEVLGRLDDKQSS